MTAVSPVRHVHANVPIVSAHDVNLVEPLIVDGACEPPVSGWPGIVRGRDEEIDRLHSLAKGATGGTTVLCGQAGCGKTTIALGMARRLISERRDSANHRVFWISAQNHTSFIDGMAAVARRLGMNDAEIARRREEGLPDLTWRLLTPPPRSSGHPLRNILVIDNADDPRLVSDVVRRATELDPAHWMVVVTTRVKGMLFGSATISVIEIDWPSADACAELLLDRIRELDRSHRELALPSARQVVDLLGRVPLALHLAGSNQGSSIARHTLSGYVGELDRVPAGRPGLRSDEPAYHLLPAMNLALGAFAMEERQSAFHVLSLLAACAPGQPFPLGALIAVVGSHFGPTAPGQAEPAVFRSIRLLQETGLVEISTHDNPHVAVIHPLIAKASSHIDGIRGATSGSAAEALDTITHGIDNGAVTFVGTGLKDAWSLWRLLIPHIAHVLSLTGAGSPAALRAAHRAIHHLMNCGMYRSAAQMAKDAERAVGHPDVPAVARRTALLDRGLTMHACGDDPKGAFRYIEEVALKTRRQCPSSDTQAMLAEHCLATILHDQGNLAASERLFAQVLAERQTHLGPGHLDTLTTMHRLAMVRQEAGRAANAEDLLLQVQAGRAGQLGAEHPDTLSARHSLAYARQARGGPTSLEDAEREFGEVLVDRIRVLGHTHPNTLITRHNLAWIEQARGNYARAEKEFRDVMRTQMKRLGKIHPHTVATAANLAWDLLQQKQFAAARLLFTQVLKVRFERLGVRHPDTQTTRGNIGWLTYEEAYFHLAEHRFRKLRDDRITLLGPRHPRTLTTRHNLALSLRSQNKLHAARDEFLAVLADQTEFIGADHDSTLATTYNLAVTLRMLNEKAWLTQAMQLLDEVLRLLRERPDPNNPLMRQTKREIVTLLAIKSERADVQELLDDGPETSAEAPETTVDDALVREFVDDDIDDFVDPDLVDYVPPSNGPA